MRWTDWFFLIVIIVAVGAGVFLALVGDLMWGLGLVVAALCLLDSQI
jgi:hypothetical protein